MKSAFTLVELVVIMGLVAALVGLITINLLRPRYQASIQAATTTLFSDLRHQQFKSQLGTSHGVYIESERYVLFQGDTYDPDSGANFAVDIDKPVQLSTSFAGGQIVFSPGGGEVAGFEPDQNTVTITSEGQNSVTLTINAYGTIETID